jgi:hypothetical protein
MPLFLNARFRNRNRVYYVADAASYPNSATWFNSRRRLFAQERGRRTPDAGSWGELSRL